METGAWQKRFSPGKLPDQEPALIDVPIVDLYTSLMIPGLSIRRNSGGAVREVEKDHWRMEISAGPQGVYRWAQLDDYMGKARRDFVWQPPLSLTLRARVSAADLPGTWGFGLWNDPFSASLGIGGTTARLPALPGTAWFFYAGPPNYLALRDTHPAQGLLAASFASPRIPAALLAPGALALPLLAARPTARLLRRAASRLIGEDAAQVPGDPTQWRIYQLDWHKEQLTFFLDGARVFSTSVSPPGPLGLVLWIDNQFVAFPPSGKVSMGMSANREAAWLEVENIQVIR